MISLQGLPEILQRYLILPIGIMILLNAPCHASSEVRANCSIVGKVVLRIGERRLSVPGAVSAVNRRSQLVLKNKGIILQGYTSIFYGGMSTYFSTFDNLVKFEATSGFGSSQRISEAMYQDKSGTYSCVLDPG